MNNPVLQKELFMRLRLRQMPIASRIGIFGTGIFLFGVIYYFVIVKWIIEDPGSNSGFDAWHLVVGIQTALVCLIAPVVTANSITQEKEQQTWEMLIFTRLLPGEIILGKLVARTVLPGLMLLFFVPIELFCWFKSHDHITASMLLLSYAVLVAMTVFFSTFGLYMSWLLNRTIYAIMSAYSFVIGGLVIGSSLITLMLTMIISDDSMYSKCPLMWINPVMMIWEAMNPKENSNTLLFLVYGIMVYVILTMLIVWRMTVGFRRFAYSE